MKTILYTTFSFFTIALLCIGCHKDNGSPLPADMPECIRERILNYPHNNQMAVFSVYRYQYHGASVYYITPDQCNDCYSELRDENCTMLCSPDGGFSGGGDGRCADFFDQRSGEQLIWQRP